MANPSVEDGYTRVANELVEKGFARTNFSAYESRVVWILLRKTYGWQKEEDVISVSQFVKETGIKRRHVQRTLNKLVERNIITKKKGYINSYCFQKDYEKWDQPHIEEQQKSTPTGASSKTVTPTGYGVAPKEVPKVAPIQVHTKEIRNYTKDMVSKIASKESLSASLDTLNVPLQVREEVLHFLDRVRQGNATKRIAPPRVGRIVQELMSVSTKYGENTLVLAQQKTIAREGFNWSIRNVTGYVETVAKNLFSQYRQAQIEEKSRAEKEALTGAKGSELFKKIMKSIH